MNWFSGLLPEGERRFALCRELGVDSYDWLGLLGEIGWECAGAVRVFPAGESRRREGSYEKAGPDELSARLSSIRDSAAPHSEGAFRISLGGFQDKLCIAMPRIKPDAVRVRVAEAGLPVGDAPSTHILKPESAAYPGLAESEAWAMTVASHAARCAKTSLLECAGAPPTLVVERYDRAGAGWPGKVQRLHQEDCCQALGLDPAAKYASSPAQKGDDPTYVGIAELLARFAEDPAAEHEELLRHLIVNYVLGNWDAHAKNMSFLYERPMVPTLAPLYDVVPIADVEPRTQVMSLRINGTLEPERITHDDVVAEAQGWGMDAERAELVVDGCLDGVEEGLAVAQELYPAAADRHARGALERIERLR